MYRQGLFEKDYSSLMLKFSIIVIRHHDQEQWFLSSQNLKAGIEAEAMEEPAYWLAAPQP